MEEDLPDGTRQSFDLSFIDFEHPENNIFQVTDEFEVERSNGKFARPDIVVLVNGIPLVAVSYTHIDVYKRQMERFVQSPSKGYGILAYPLKAFEERAATE